MTRGLQDTWVPRRAQRPQHPGVWVPRVVCRGWVQRAEENSPDVSIATLGSSEAGIPERPPGKFAEHLTFKQPSLQTRSHLLSDGFGVNM